MNTATRVMIIEDDIAIAELHHKYLNQLSGLEVVGIAEVSKLSAPDSTTDDERWDCVHIKAVCDMPSPVTLKAVKANPALSEMSLVTSMRLSVQPVTEAEWLEVCRMGGLENPPM